MTLATRVTYALVKGQPCNIQFIWDEIGPGLHVQWSADRDLVGLVVRDDTGLSGPGMFQRLTELLAGG